jgi:hypothetical protein
MHGNRYRLQTLGTAPWNRVGVSGAGVPTIPLSLMKKIRLIRLVFVTGFVNMHAHGMVREAVCSCK